MRTPSNLPPGVTDAMIDALSGPDLDPEVIDDVMADAEVVSDWLGQYFGPDSEHTAALIRIMMAGSPSAEVAAVEKLRAMFIDDNMILIDSRAENKLQRERDDRDEARGYRV